MPSTAGLHLLLPDGVFQALTKLYSRISVVLCGLCGCFILGSASFTHTAGSVGNRCFVFDTCVLSTGRSQLSQHPKFAIVPEQSFPTEQFPAIPPENLGRLVQRVMRHLRNTSQPTGLAASTQVILTIIPPQLKAVKCLEPVVPDTQHVFTIEQLFDFRLVRDIDSSHGCNLLELCQHPCKPLGISRSPMYSAILIRAFLKARYELVASLV